MPDLIAIGFILLAFALIGGRAEALSDEPRTCLGRRD